MGVEYHAGFFQHLVDITSSIGVIPRAPTMYRTCFDLITSYYLLITSRCSKHFYCWNYLSTLVVGWTWLLPQTSCGLQRLRLKPKPALDVYRAAVHSMWLFNKYKLQDSMSLDFGWANTQYLHWKSGATLEFHVGYIDDEYSIRPSNMRRGLSRRCHVSFFPRLVAHHSSLQLQLAKSNDVMWPSILGHWRPCIPFDSHRNHRISRSGRPSSLCSHAHGGMQHISKSILFHITCGRVYQVANGITGNNTEHVPKLIKIAYVWEKHAISFLQSAQVTAQDCHYPSLFNISESQSAWPVSCHILASVIKVGPAMCINVDTNLSAHRRLFFMDLF